MAKPWSAGSWGRKSEVEERLRKKQKRAELSTTKQQRDESEMKASMVSRPSPPDLSSSSSSPLFLELHDINKDKSGNSAVFWGV